MRKLMLALVAASMSAAISGAYAAQGSPADSDKAGRMPPGTSASQMGATDPTPGKAGASTKGGAMGAGATAGSASSSAGAGGASASTGGGSSAAAGTGDDMGKAKGKRSRRAARASKG